MSRYEHTVYAIGDLDDLDDESAGFDGEAWDDYEPGDDYPGMGERVTDNQGGESVDRETGEPVPYNPLPQSSPGTANAFSGGGPIPGFSGSKPGATGASEEGGGAAVQEALEQGGGGAVQVRAKEAPAPIVKKKTSASKVPWGLILFGVATVGATIGVGYYMHTRARKKGRR